MKLLVRILVSAIGLGVAAWLVEGITVGPEGSNLDRALTLLGVAVVFGLVNALIRPLLKLLSLPLLILTLGLFTFVLNALMLLLTSWIADRLDLPFLVQGFWAALLGALIVSIVSFLINVALPDRYET